MLGFVKRPRLTAQLAVTRAVSHEFARRVELVGRMTIQNAGGDAQLRGTEMIVIAGFRRIPLTVPLEWTTIQVASGGSRELQLNCELTLDAPLRAPAGELYVVAMDQRGSRWEWRLPFRFEQQ